MGNPCFVVTALACGVLSAQDWRPSYPVTDPGPRVGNRMAFDAARGELVMFGGQLLPSPANADTWVWNGTNWTQRSPAASPGARQYHAMCYDAGRQRVVVYSGQLGTALLNDIWEWDGTTWTHPLPAVSPPARHWPVIVYDGTRVLLFGGGSSAAPRNDTWAWNGTTWTQLTPASSPSPRYYHSMASNGAGEVLLFGGFDPTFGYLADTWIFSGNNWSQAAPATPPAARGLTMMAYDSTNSRYLAFAGTNSFFTPWEDTWAYAAGQWTQLATQRSPSTRRGGGAAWFAPLNRFVIYSAEYLSQANLKSTAMWEFGQNLASFIRFGPSECPAIDPPVLRAYQSQPALGTTFEARVESFSSVINLAVLGLSDTTWAGGPLPFDMSAVGTNPLCFLRVSTEVLATLGVGFSSSWFLPIPVSGSFLGFTMYVQGWTWGQGTFPTNLSAGNAATLVVGAN